MNHGRRLIDATKPALELLQHLLRVLVAVLLQGRREEVVCLLAVTFGQVALDVAILVQSTPLVDELLAVSVFERLDRSPRHHRWKFFARLDSCSCSGAVHVGVTRPRNAMSEISELWSWQRFG